MISLPEELRTVIERHGTVVVPSPQRAEAARQAYAAEALGAGRRVWRSPDILPLEAWLSREIGRVAAGDADVPRLLSPAEQWLLWRQATAHATARLDLVARAPLAEGLRRADQLAFEFCIDTQGLRAAGTEQALLAAVRASVQERQRALRATTAAQLAATLPHIGDERPVVFAGFAALTPQLASLIGRRQSRGFETRMIAVPPSRARACVVLATDSADELERIAAWCRERFAKKADARLLVVLAGPAAAREQLLSLIHQTLDPRRLLEPDASDTRPLVGIEGGEPLSRSPMVAHALNSLIWLTDQADFETVSEWLRAPYWRTPNFAERCRLDLWLRERAPLEPAVRDLQAALAQAPAALAEAARSLSAQLATAMQWLGRGMATPREWSERFHAAFQALGWPGDRALSSDESQTRERFFELLKELGALGRASGLLSRDSAIQWLNEFATRTAFRPASGDALVTISASLADPVVRYDGVWVAQLHAEAWPQPVQPDPFLPLPAQIAAGVPAASAAGRLAQARDLMQAWSAATDDLVLSTPSAAEDLQLWPSPLLKELPASTASSAAAPSGWLPSRLHREKVLERFADTTGLPWLPRAPLPGGTFSLHLQNECPFRAYAQLRLGSEPLEAPEPGVAADVRGDLLHRALEKLWGRLGNLQNLLALTAAQTDALIEACVAEAADAIWRVPRATPPQERERRRARRLIGALCNLERERAPFTVLHTELETQLSIAGAQLRVRIDRLDSLAAGGLVILDYKSGRRTVGDWYAERPSHIQLLAYLAAVGAEVRAMATVNVTAREVRFAGIGATANLLPKVEVVESLAQGEAWAVRCREWHERLERIASEFLSGHAAVDPRAGACKYCHVTSLCRIADLRAFAQETNGDE